MRIIVASDNKSTRDAIAMLVRVQPDLELAGEAGDIAELLAQIKATESPLVVFDWDALGQRIDTLMDLLELFHEPPAIVALSVNEGARADALSAGIPNFAHKREPPDQLLATIRESNKSRPSISEGRNGKPLLSAPELGGKHEHQRSIVNDSPEISGSPALFVCCVLWCEQSRVACRRDQSGRIACSGLCEGV
jgi:DNA-binding NarL/FixJ family response regulator